MSEEKETTKQVTPPELRNPTGKGGFGDNPQNRSDGRWDKENSFSYWYNYFKDLTVEEFKAESAVPDNEKSVARDLAYVRIVNSRDDLSEFKEVANRTEGSPKQSMDITSGGKTINPLKELTDEELDEEYERINKEENQGGESTTGSKG